MIDYSLTQFDRLPSQAWSAWNEMLCSNGSLQSPYFRPEFMAAMHHVGHRVEVGVIQQDERIVGLFPFERTFWNTGKPVGGSTSDFHGIIAPKNLAIDWPALLKACGLRAWEFTAYVPSGQSPTSFRRLPSPYIDLSGGYTAYCQQRKQAGSETIGKTIRKVRRLHKDFGLRFEYRHADNQLFDLLLDWKKRHYQQLGIAAPFDVSRMCRLWKHLSQNSTPELSGQLCVLWAGNSPAALTFCLLSQQTAHVWFIGYDETFSRYSPGLILLLQFAEQAAAEGIRTIHFGLGQERFKTSLASGHSEVSEGSIGATGLTNRWLNTWQHTKFWLKQSPLIGPIRWSRAMISTCLS